MINSRKHRTDLPYSYHTFMLAFSFEGTLDDKKTGNWKQYSLRKSDHEELNSKYNTFQYFTPEARELMFNESSDHRLIRRFVYDIPENADGEYVITKTLEKTDKNKVGKEIKTRYFEVYSLFIDNIKAIVFPNNIAIIQFDLENHENSKERSNIDSVNRINEYGRRINLPFIQDENLIHPLVADTISILGHTFDFKKNGKQALEDYKNKRDDNNIIYPIRRLVEELLPNCKNYSPVIDDRMFVCCLVRDEAFSQEIKSIYEKKDDPIPVIGKDIYTDRNLSNKIYAFAYIDADGSSCQSPEMRESLLKRCIYSRWRDWGTIDVITHHSFMRLTGPQAPSHIITSFLTQYVTMASGVLLQRATIMKLSKECADISSDFFEKELSKKESKTLNERIRKLKRDYVYAQNNIFLNHFTAQEQGSDEFNMLRNEMYIKDSLKNLSHKVNGIYDFTTESAEDEENSLLNALTIFGLPLSLMQTLAVIISFSCFAGMFPDNHYLEWILFGVILAVSVGISVVVIRIYKRYCAQKNKKH